MKKFNYLRFEEAILQLDFEHDLYNSVTSMKKVCQCHFFLGFTKIYCSVLGPNKISILFDSDFNKQQLLHFATTFNNFT